MSWSSVVSGLSPSSWWRLGEASGNAADSGSGGKTLTKGSSGITQNQTSLVPLDTADKSCKFDGTVTTNAGFIGGDYYDFVNRASFTIMAAFKLDGSGPSNNKRIIDKVATYGWRLFVQATSNKLAFQRVTSSGTDTFLSSAALSDNTTYFVVVTYDGSNIKVYLNGVLLDSAVAATFNIDNTAAGVAVGATSGGASSFGGWLDEVAVWDGTALTSTDVTDLYNAFGAPPTVTLASSGTLDGTTLGADMYGAMVLGVTQTAGSTPLTGVVVERSLDNSTWADITANCLVTITASGAVVADTRPNLGSQAVAALGDAVYYRVKGTNAAGNSVSYTSTAHPTTAAPDQDKVKASRAALAHTAISTATGGHVGAGHAFPTGQTTGKYLQIGQWLHAMAECAYMSQTVANWATNGGPTLAQCVTDAQNQWDEIKWQVTNNGHGKFICLDEGAGAGTFETVGMDGHFRPIMHSLMAARLLLRTGDATAATLAADIRSYCEEWLKNAFDLLRGGDPLHTFTNAGWDADEQPAVARNTAYAVGDLRRPTTPNGTSWRVKTAGTTHATTEPTWTHHGALTIGFYALSVGTTTLKTWGTESWASDGAKVGDTISCPGILSPGTTITALSGDSATISQPTIASAITFQNGSVTSPNAGAEVTDGTVVWKETSRSMTTFPGYFYNDPTSRVGADGVTTTWAVYTDTTAAEQSHIVNKEMVVATCLAFATQDLTAFKAGGTHHARATSIIAEVVDWATSAFSLANGSMPYATYSVAGVPWDGPATVYASFISSMLAIIHKLGLDTSNTWQTLPATTKLLDWMESTGHGTTEPYARWWVDSTVALSMTDYVNWVGELGFMRAAYAILDRTNPYATVQFTRAVTDAATGKQSAYRKFGGGAVETNPALLFAPFDQFATQDSAIDFTLDPAIRASATATGRAVADLVQDTAGRGAATATGRAATNTQTDAALRAIAAAAGFNAGDTYGGVTHTAGRASATAAGRGAVDRTPGAAIRRPFFAPLDLASVTAPLDVVAVTAPLDMDVEA